MQGLQTQLADRDTEMTTLSDAETDKLREECQETGFSLIMSACERLKEVHSAMQEERSQAKEREEGLQNQLGEKV